MSTEPSCDLELPRASLRRPLREGVAQRLVQQPVLERRNLNLGAGERQRKSPPSGTDDVTYLLLLRESGERLSGPDGPQVLALLEHQTVRHSDNQNQKLETQKMYNQQVRKHGLTCPVPRGLGRILWESTSAWHQGDKSSTKRLLEVFVEYSLGDCVGQMLRKLKRYNTARLESSATLRKSKRSLGCANYDPCIKQPVRACQHDNHKAETNTRAKRAEKRRHVDVRFRDSVQCVCNDDEAGPMLHASRVQTLRPARKRTWPRCTSCSAASTSAASISPLRGTMRRARVPIRKVSGWRLPLRCARCNSDADRGAS